MNEQANSAQVQALYDAFAKGDLQTILGHLSADVEWNAEGPASLPFTGKRKGPEEVKGFFAGLASTQTGMKLIPEHYVAQGDTVATVGRYSGTVTATGKKFDVQYGHFFTIRDGKVVRYVNLIDTGALIEAYS